jgi:hypothetical protein
MFTAPDTSNTVTIAVNFSGVNVSEQFTVLEPASESAVIYQSNLLSYPSGPPIPPGALGVSMFLTPIIVGPTNVSFANVEVRELSGPATNVTGFFTNYLPNLYHNADPNWDILTKSNGWDDAASMTNNLPRPWYPGSFDLIIPVQWQLVFGATHIGSLPNRKQTISINDTNGTATVSKLQQSVTRKP